MRGLVGRLSLAKVPTIVIVMVWVYCAWRVWRSDWLQESYTTAREYRRSVHL